MLSLPLRLTHRMLWEGRMRRSPQKLLRLAHNSQRAAAPQRSQHHPQQCQEPQENDLQGPVVPAEEALDRPGVQGAGDNVDARTPTNGTHHAHNLPRIRHDQRNARDDQQQHHRCRVLSPHQVESARPVRRQSHPQQRDGRLAQPAEHKGEAGNDGEAHAQTSHVDEPVLLRIVLQDDAVGMHAKRFKASHHRNTKDYGTDSHRCRGAASKLRRCVLFQLAIILAAVVVREEGNSQSVQEHKRREVKVKEVPRRYIRC
mmetsp:Transcript_66281/g.153925  ORF Transcript_66281/g.153925 Transcript_66281/m.153925 type:complete len:258 (+) Transcript_66281:100-873(+)